MTVYAQQRTGILCASGGDRAAYGAEHRLTLYAGTDVPPERGDRSGGTHETAWRPVIPASPFGGGGERIPAASVFERYAGVSTLVADHTFLLDG